MTPFKKLSLYTSESSRLGSRPTYAAIMAAALEQEVYSAIAIKAFEGFGPQMVIPTPNRMAHASDLPIEIRILDYPSVVEAFLAKNQDLLANCLIIQEDIEVVQSPAN